MNKHEQYTGWKVTAGFLARDLIADAEGLDVGASCTRYCELCAEALRRAYPGAQIQVGWNMEPGTMPLGLDLINAEGESVDARDVLAVNANVILSGDWRVKKA